ncbi:GTPase IMAP family member 8-like [Clupea harengus]|uniref:GTPase IMAP family member 8-like n=1 Tax=Clupea harengus TaxID=7950 RepID=A0A6P3VX95_CLUHA|nr:GTPase IMAP family member 8-like [Clupea harengus]
MALDADKDGQCLPLKELRIILLGWNQLENRLVGNAILGHEAFDTERDTEMCIGKQGISADGTQLTVVSTPQNWLHYAVHDPAFVEHRMATSASMCQPGPHVFLVVVPVDSLPGKERTLEAALILLSDILWQYSMVVLTGLEKQTALTIQNMEYECLQSIFEKCGHRYHCLNTSQLPHDSGTQAMDLLKSMMAMGASNQCQTGENFLCTDSMLKEAERRIMLINEKAKDRILTAQKEYQTHKLLQAGSPSRQTALRVVMVGARLVGKSTAGNVILGQEVFQSGHPTLCCVETEGDAMGRNISLVDTPGWHGRGCSIDTSEEASLQIAQSTYFGDAEPNAFLVVIRCDETFTEADKRLLQEHLNLWGRDVWRRSIALFTWGDRLGDTTVEQHIERWPALVWFMEKCGNRYHVLDNVVRTCNCKVKELVEEIEEVDLINDSQLLLQMLLKAEKNKKKQQSKVKELQKKVRDLQRNYGQQLEDERKLQDESNKRVQETLQSCSERERLMKEKEQWIKRSSTESEKKKKELQEEIEQLTQKCDEQDRMLQLMRRDQVASRHGIFNEEKESRDHKLWQSDQNNTFENICSEMETELLKSDNLQHIPSEDLQLNWQREVKTMPLNEAEARPEKGQTDIGTESMSRTENMHSTEAAIDHVELDSAVAQGAETPTQEVKATQQHPQKQPFKQVGTTNGLEGAVIGAVVGILTGLRGGPRRTAIATAIGASVGALLDTYLWANVNR